LEKNEILKKIKDKKNFSLYQDEIFKNITILDKEYKVFKYYIKKYIENKTNNSSAIFGEKIVYNTLKKDFAFAYTNVISYPSKTVNIIKSKRINLKYLVAILNSKLIYFYLSDRRIISPKLITSLPLQQIKDTEPFEILVDYIVFLKNLDKDIDKYASNENIIKYHFEELIDALVYELYFKEEFQEKNIEFFKYTKKYLKSIKNLNDNEKKDTVRKVYLLLNEQENKIRNNLELMTIRLKDLILPIKRNI